jgi:hypothetical protein
MNRQLLISFTVIALAGAITAFSPKANAASDVKIFSSMVCRANGAASLDVLTYSYQGVFNTSSTQNAVIICPLEKDSEYTMLDADGTNATLTVNVKAPGGATGLANCTVEVGSLSSGAYSASASSGTIAAGNTATLNMDVQTADTWWNEPINLVCGLGPRVRLTRIFMTEHGATNTP